MPVIKSAIKKLRKDRKLEKQNDVVRDNLRKAIKKAEKEMSATAVQAAFSLIDRAVKKNLLHKNRAARIKSRLSKTVKGTPAKKATPAKKTTVKAKAPATKAKAPKKAAAK